MWVLRKCGRGGVRGGVLKEYLHLRPKLHQITHTTGHIRVVAVQVARGGKKGCVGEVPQS